MDQEGVRMNWGVQDHNVFVGGCVRYERHGGEVLSHRFSNLGVR